MKRLVVTLVAAAAPGVAQTVNTPPVPRVDTVITVRGIVQNRAAVGAGRSAWMVYLPLPQVVQRVRTNSLELEGQAAEAGRHVDEYVEAKGHVVSRPDSGGGFHLAMLDADLREVDPDGLGSTNVEMNLLQRAIVSVAVVPQRFAWRDSAGAPTHVTPSILFSIRNIGQIDLTLGFKDSNGIICVHVRPEGFSSPDERTWRYAGTSRSLRIGQAVTFRQVLPLPDSSADHAGRYTVVAALCDDTQGFDLRNQTGGHGRFGSQTDIEVRSGRPR